MRTNQATARRSLGDIPERLAELDRMTVGQLVAKYRELYGEPTRSRNRTYLQKRLAWRIQELAEGGLQKSAIELITRLGDAMPERWSIRLDKSKPTPMPDPSRDARLPPTGAVLTRVYRGTTHEVRVLSDGFEYQGARFGSLSKVAKQITGTQWNGLAFFGLTTREPRTDRAPHPNVAMEPRR